MDAKEKIKGYIMPKGLSVVAMLLVIAALVLSIVGMMNFGSAETVAQDFYPSESENGSMAYIKVVGVSDWILKYDGETYYSVEDAEGYMYTVKLTDSQFADMEAQQEYWNRETEDAPMPKAFYLEGVVRAVAGDVRKDLAECWSITEEDYDWYFGTKLLDATTTAAQAASATWFVFAAICGISGLVLMVCTASVGARAKKCLQSLEERGQLERAAMQLGNTECNKIVGKNRAVLTQDFLFGKGTGMAIAYGDIIWCYQLDRRTYMIPTNSLLMVGTMANGTVAAVDLNRYDRNGVIAEVLETIAQRNPDVMVGYNGENVRNFARIRKAK